MKYVYFVAYNYWKTKSSRPTPGRCLEFCTANKMDNLESLKRIEEVLRKEHGFHLVAITNFQLLRVLDEDGILWLSKDSNGEIYNIHFQTLKPEPDKSGFFEEYSAYMCCNAFCYQYPDLHFECGECRRVKREELSWRNGRAIGFDYDG